LGLAVAKHLIESDWRVTIFDLNSAEGTRAVQVLGDNAIFVQGDVIQYKDQAKAFIEAWDKWGRLDLGV